MFVTVDAIHMGSVAGRVGELAGEMSTAVGSFAAAICNTAPAGLDDASLLAAGRFGASGADFSAVGQESQVVLGQSATALAYAAKVYAGQEAANTALLS